MGQAVYDDLRIPAPYTVYTLAEKNGVKAASYRFTKVQPREPRSDYAALMRDECKNIGMKPVCGLGVNCKNDKDALYLGQGGTLHKNDNALMPKITSADQDLWDRFDNLCTYTGQQNMEKGQRSGTSKAFCLKGGTPSMWESVPTLKGTWIKKWLKTVQCSPWRTVGNGDFQVCTNGGVRGAQRHHYKRYNPWKTAALYNPGFMCGVKMAKGAQEPTVRVPGMVHDYCVAAAATVGAGSRPYSSKQLCKTGFRVGFEAQITGRVVTKEARLPVKGVTVSFKVPKTGHSGSSKSDAAGLGC